MFCAATVVVTTPVLDVWRPRDQHISPAETLAPSAALGQHPEVFRGRDMLWFVDNESACSTLVRGASSQEDVAGIAECTHLVVMALGCRIWWEWVDTKANPSDGLSRDGLQCPRYGARAVEAKLPDWHVMQFNARRFEAIHSTYGLDRTLDEWF